MKLVWGVAALVGVTLTTPVWAEEAHMPAPANAAAPAEATLDLSIRARALGLVPEPLAAGTLGLETMRAPTGAGTTRMPAAGTGRETGGLYIGVVVCDPDGVERLYTVRANDEGSLPEGPIRAGAAAPRGLYLPGRPIP